MFNFFKELKISTKLPIICSIIVILAILSTTYVTIGRSSEHILQASKNKLLAYNIKQKTILEDYLSTIKQDLTINANNHQVSQAILDFTEAWKKLGKKPKNVLQDLYIYDNIFPIGEKDKLNKANDDSLYSKFHSHYHPWFRLLLTEKGYYDIFLFDLEGNLIYSVFKELDYATNMLSGEWKNSDLAKAFVAAKKSSQAFSNQQSFFDFQPYGPSHGAPASFISQAVYDQNHQPVGILAFQMPIDKMNHVMQLYEGLGNTGESYIVGMDNLMRTNSRFIKSSTILKQAVNSAAVKKAFNKTTLGFELDKNYMNQEVMTAYTNLTFFDSKWAIITEQQTSEIYAPINNLKKVIMFYILIPAFFTILISFMLGRNIGLPITKIAQTMRRIVGGDYDLKVPYIDRKDEIGEISKIIDIFKKNTQEKAILTTKQKEAEEKAQQARKEAMLELANKFESEFSEITSAITSLSEEMVNIGKTTEENIARVNDNARSVTETSHETSNNVNTIASAAEEMAASIKEITDQINNSTLIVNESVNKASDSQTQAISLDKATQEIGDVITLIKDIAEQINLLALNATIESARAGEAGKSFAVVASEVKNLATQTTKAIADISTKIQTVQHVSAEVSQSFNSIKESIDQVNQYSSGISSAVEEQSATTDEIASSMQIAARSTQDVNEKIAEITTFSDNNRESAKILIKTTKDMAEKTRSLNHSLKTFLVSLRHDQ